VAAAETHADRTDVTSVFLEDEEVVLGVVGDEVDASVLVLGEGVGVDHRCDRRIGLGPLEIERIAGWSMTEDDGGLRSDKRGDEEQSK
jgi:hypothetical protein